MTGHFKHNPSASRFEYHQDGQFAFADYRIINDTLFIDYVESPHLLRGTGAASRLMSDITAFAKAENLNITPICGYAATWMRRHQDKQ